MERRAQIRKFEFCYTFSTHLMLRTVMVTCSKNFSRKIKGFTGVPIRSDGPKGD